jgi:two-component system cell cycle sensor histidine kinase/response regulator CckA
LQKRVWWQLPSARIAIGFVIWSALWVVLSDYILHTFVHDAVSTLWKLETVKGLVYVLTTGISLYFFVRAREREYFAARRTTENRLRRLSESNLISICYWKPGGEITDANDAFLNLLGYSREDLLEKKLNWHDFTPPEYAVHDKEYLKMLLSSGHHINYEKEFVRKDHTLVPVLIGAAMLDPSNSRGIAYVLDLSDLKNAKERSTELEQQLRQAQKLEAVGQLASGIAHDFNNLLNVVIGYASLIDAQADSETPLSEQAKRILKAAEKATGLVRKLLAFGRKQLLKPELVDVNATLREYELIMPKLIGENIRLDLRLSPSLWLVEVDQNQLEQVIINLAVNARDAMPFGGKLTITTMNDVLTNRVSVIVSDTGVGMSGETKARMFDPFYTTKPEGQGSGLGLSTVYGIVSQSGGNIAVSSELGHGTTFTIHLPKSNKSLEGESTMKEHVRTPSLELLSSKSNQTILLAEDEPDLRELFTSLLRINGYRVLPARDGEEAIGLAKTHNGPIELLVTDIVMPRINGVEAAKAIRSIRPNLRIIYMTGYAEDSLLTSRPLSNETLLEKPVSPPLLFETIRLMLNTNPRRHTA